MKIEFLAGVFQDWLLEKQFTRYTKQEAHALLQCVFNSTPFDKEDLDAAYGCMRDHSVLLLHKEKRVLIISTPQSGLLSKIQLNFLDGDIEVFEGITPAGKMAIRTLCTVFQVIR
jgi:hypothetical protein